MSYLFMNSLEPVNPIQEKALKKIGLVGKGTLLAKETTNSYLRCHLAPKLVLAWFFQLMTPGSAIGNLTRNRLCNLAQ